MQEIYGSETSEDDIQTFLLEKEQETGAFCCDNNVFREIVNLHVREMRRNDTPCGVDDCAACKPLDEDPEKRAVYEADGSDAFKRTARGRPFTKVGANQFWVLLPGATGENGGARFRRVSIGSKKGIPEKRCDPHL